VRRGQRNGSLRPYSRISRPVYQHIVKRFILGFCILLRVLSQGYCKNRLSQQLFKLFIYIYFSATCFRPRWPSSGGIHNIFGKLPHYNGSVDFVLKVFFCIWFGKYSKSILHGIQQPTQDIPPTLAKTIWNNLLWKLRSMLCIDTAFYVFYIYILIS
jgi:hypothetical protein